MRTYLGVLRGRLPDVERPIPRVVRVVLELEVLSRIIRVLDPKVPTRGLVVASLDEVAQVPVRRVLALIASGLDQKCREARPREIGRERSTAGSASNNDVIVRGRIHGRNGR